MQKLYDSSMTIRSVVFPFIILAALLVSTSTAQDTGARDTLVFDCPLSGSYAVGETLSIPIYVVTDQELNSVLCVFKYSCNNLGFVGAQLAPRISSIGGNMHFSADEIAAPGSSFTVVQIGLGMGPEWGLEPLPLFNPSHERQLFATAKFSILDASCCYLDLDTTSAGDFIRTLYEGGIIYTPEILACSQSTSSVNCPVDIFEMAEEFELPRCVGAPHPNPFNSGTSIEVTTTRTGPLNITIYDILGRRVRTIIDETISSGSHQFLWDGSDESGRSVASGVYFMRVSSSSQVETRKLVLLR